MSLAPQADLPHRDTLPVLGRRVVFETNYPTVLEAVDRSFGGWRRLADAFAEPSPTCRVRVFVEEGDEGASERPPFRTRLPSPQRLIVTTPGSVAVAEADRHEAYAFVTTDLVDRDAEFRYGILEALTLMLVTSTDRHPLHAATVAKDGAALLLAGPSGVGKSTLAYAAGRAGLEVRGDEAAYVQRGGRLRLWGMPGRVRLSPTGASHFPELRGRAPEVWGSGKLKVVVHFDVPESTWCPVERAAVCLLAAGDGPVGAARVDSATLLDSLTSRLEPGFDLRPDEVRLVAEALARPGGWRLQLSQDPAEAVDCLKEMLDAIRTI